MIIDLTKFDTITNSHELSWFLGVDHHNFKRLIRHMMVNKECTVITKQNIKSARYHPPHSNRSMQIFLLNPAQVKFLVVRQSVYWASTFFEKIDLPVVPERDPSSDPDDMHYDHYRPEGTYAYWELSSQARKVAFAHIYAVVPEKSKSFEIAAACVQYAYTKGGLPWKSPTGDYFDEMVKD